ncbi:hypothetical protein HanPI659440_Chr15g0576371 [Helianthus annuus]|nr:hypothetical protein HanPI659440_Chr15g0576371 [Helianthus annuus]
MICEKRVVTSTLHEAHGSDKIRKPLVPCPGCLFEPVKRLFETTHVVWIVAMAKTHRLIHIYSLRKISMKKRVGNIELMNGPRL